MRDVQLDHLSCFIRTVPLRIEKIAPGNHPVVLSARGEPVLGPIAAVILLEFSFINFRSSMIVGDVVSDNALAVRVGPVVTELCDRAKCVAPRIMLRDDLVRVAGVMRVKGRITILLSGPFSERVSDQELTALLAHEVVHIARDDLKAANGRAIVGVLDGCILAGRFQGVTATTW